MIYIERLQERGGLLTESFPQLHSRPDNYPEDKKYLFLYNHIQRSLELLLPLTDGIRFIVGSNEYKTQAGDVIVVNPYEAHSAYLPTDVSCAKYICVVIDIEYFAPTLPAGDRETVKHLLKGRLSFKSHIAADSAERIFRAANEHLDSCLNMKNTRLCAASYTILAELLECFLAEAPDEHYRNISLAKQIEEFMETNFAEPLTTSDMAKLFNYSEGYFCRLFKQIFLIPFKRYLIQYRLRRARELRDSGMSLTDIAIAVGFNNYAYFSREFKKYHHKLPKDYFQ